MNFLINRWKLIFLGIFIFLLYEARDREEPIEEPQKQIIQDIIAYDWENNRDITQPMADTMIFTSGHWYNKSHPPIKDNFNWTQSFKPKWIRPADKYRKLKKSKELELLWQEQQLINNQEQLTEEDIRQIVREENDY